MMILEYLFLFDLKNLSRNADTASIGLIPNNRLYVSRGGVVYHCWAANASFICPLHNMTSGPPTAVQGNLLNHISLQLQDLSSLCKLNKNLP